MTFNGHENPRGLNSGHERHLENVNGRQYVRENDNYARA